MGRQTSAVFIYRLPCYPFYAPIINLYGRAITYDYLSRSQPPSPAFFSLQIYNLQTFNLQLYNLQTWHIRVARHIIPTFLPSRPSAGYHPESLAGHRPEFFSGGQGVILRLFPASALPTCAYASEQDCNLCLPSSVLCLPSSVSRPPSPVYLRRRRLLGRRAAGSGAGGYADLFEQLTLGA